MEKPIKFVVVGAGTIGKRHIEMIQFNPSCELVSVVDTNEAIHKPGLPYFLSLDDYFQTGPECDVMIIASPNGLHAVQAIRALENGKHVIIEKPMALSSIEGQNIYDSSKKHQKHVFIVMQNRYSPTVKWLKSIIEQGILGKIYLVQINCFWNRDERYYKKNSWHGSLDLDGGSLFTQFSHFVDFLYWIFGDIHNISSIMNNYSHQELTEFEDTGIINFNFADGGMGSLNFSTAVRNENLESNILIIAENGSIKIGGQYMDRILLGNIKDYVFPDEFKNSSSEDGKLQNLMNHAQVIENVVNVLTSNGSTDTSILEGMKVIKIIEKMYSSKKPAFN